MASRVAIRKPGILAEEQERMRPLSGQIFHGAAFCAAFAFEFPASFFGEDSPRLPPRPRVCQSARVWQCRSRRKSARGWSRALVSLLQDFS